MKKKLLLNVIVLLLYTCLGFSQARITSTESFTSLEIHKKISKTLSKYDLIDVNIPEFLASISSQKETRLIWNIEEKKVFDTHLVMDRNST